MRRFNTALFLFGVFLLIGAGCETQDPSNATDSSDDLTYYVDVGVRVGDASNPGVKIDADGNVLLLYQDRNTEHQSNIAIATEDSDWLDFSVMETNVNVFAFRALKLPDGTYRSYGPDSTVGLSPGAIGFTSRSSIDGVNFTDDDGYRYILQDNDYGRVGVYEFFIDSQDNVVLLYIGNMGEGANTDDPEVNTVRRAYSTDGGWTFEYDRGMILGDETNIGSHAYVDEKILSLGDGRWRLITMKQGCLYSFLSEDDGYSFELEDFELCPEDFTEFDVNTLNDPILVQLPDGRFRIYVTAQMDAALGEKKPSAIVSATTR